MAKHKPYHILDTLIVNVKAKCEFLSNIITTSAVKPVTMQTVEKYPHKHDCSLPFQVYFKEIDAQNTHADIPFLKSIYILYFCIACLGINKYCLNYSRHRDRCPIIRGFIVHRCRSFINLQVPGQFYERTVTVACVRSAGLGI